MNLRPCAMAAVLLSSVCAFARTDQEWFNAGVDYRVCRNWLVHFDLRSRFELRDKKGVQLNEMRSSGGDRDGINSKCGFAVAA